MTEREEIIVMLKTLRENIKPMAICSPMETVIRDTYSSSTDFVLKKTIDYLEKEND